MRFDQIKFIKAKPDEAYLRMAPKELRDLNYPWFEAEIPRVIFKDCANKIAFQEDYFDDSSIDEIERAKASTSLTANVEITGKLNEFHEGAYNHFIENSDGYEKRLRDYLFAKTQENLASAIAYEDSPELRAFIKKHALDSCAGLNKQLF